MVQTVAIQVESLTDGMSHILGSRTMLTQQCRYVERLEGERDILSLGLQEACRRLIVAGCWPRDSLPPDGRPHGIYEMLVTLGLIPDSKDKKSAGASVERGDSARPTRESLAANHASVERTLDRGSYQDPYTRTFVEHNEPHETWSRPRDAHIESASAQPTVATLAARSSGAKEGLSKKSSETASRATDLQPEAALKKTQDFQDSSSHPEGQLWRHTTDAYQEVSGPSNIRKRSFSAISTARGFHHDGITPEHRSNHQSGTYEAVFSGQDEPSSESDGDMGDHIKIAF